MLRSLRLRFGFCAAIAVIAASLADPIAEFCSNAGLFGAGRYTDHSNLDVVPACLAGLGLLAFFLVRKAPAILSGQLLSDGIARSLPAILILQLMVLYLMETAEQVLVWGHPLGPTIWLGAPAPVSVAIHACAALVVLYVVVGSRKALARTTLRVIRLIQAIATLAAAVPQPHAPRRRRCSVFEKLVRAVCAIGERAPPFATR